MRKRKRGFVLFLAIAAMAPLLVFVMRVTSSSLLNLGMLRQDVFDHQARYAALAAIEEAKLALAEDSSWSAGFTSRALPRHAEWTSTVEVTNNIASAAPATAADGVVVPPGYAYLRARGSVHGIEARASVLLRQSATYEYAVFADRGVSLGGGSAVDAYDSRSGPYLPHAWQKDAPVATNGETPGAVSASSNTLIDGDVRVGPHGDPATAASLQGTVTGTVEPSTRSFIFNPVAPTLTPANGDVSASGAVDLAPGAYGRLNAQTAVITLHGGTYTFAGDVSLSGGSTLIVDPTTGPVVIYVSGSWDSTGGAIVNTTQQAANLRIFGTAACTSLGMTGGSQCYAAVCAPFAQVSFTSSGDLFGCLYGRTVTMGGGSSVHYDLSLRDVRIVAPVTSFHWL